MESLRIKETDRIAALQTELNKIGTILTEKSSNSWELMPAEFIPPDQIIEVSTYDDHRMAMAFAPLACKTNLIIQNPEVVDKSYPEFWEDLSKAGVKVKRQPK